MTANRSVAPTSRGGSPGVNGGVLQIGALRQVVDGREAVEVHRAGYLSSSRRGVSANCCSRKSTMSCRAVGRGLEPYRRAVAALRQFALERAAQVIDFFIVDEQVAVARQAELIAAQHLHAFEQVRHQGFDDGGQRDEAPARAAVGQRHDARQ